MAKKFCGARLESDLWREVKVAAIKSGKGLADWVADALRAALPKQKAERKGQ